MIEVDWASLALLDDGALQAELLGLADSATDGKTGAGEDAAVAGLPEPVRVIWLLNWLDYEVSQGSLLAYFFNSHGRFAIQTADVLDRIGATGMAQVVRQAEAAVAANAGDWAARHDEMDQAGEYAVVRPYRGLTGTDRLSSLTDEYWAAAEADQWGQKLDKYLREAVKAEYQGRSYRRDGAEESWRYLHSKSAIGATHAATNVESVHGQGMEAPRGRRSGSDGSGRLLQPRRRGSS